MRATFTCLERRSFVFVLLHFSGHVLTGFSFYPRPPLQKQHPLGGVRDIIRWRVDRWSTRICLQLDAKVTSGNATCLWPSRLHVLALAGSVNRQALRLRHGALPPGWKRAASGQHGGAPKRTWWDPRATARRTLVRQEKGNSTGQQQQQQQQQCDLRDASEESAEEQQEEESAPSGAVCRLVLELLGLVDSLHRKRGATSAFDLLLRNYAPSLQKRDPRLWAYQGGAVHFNWQPPRQTGLLGMMENRCADGLSDRTYFLLGHAPTAHEALMAPWAPGRAANPAPSGAGDKAS